MAKFELLSDRLIAAEVGALQVIEQAAALADHHQQTATGAVILLVALQMLGQVVDALRQQGDLHVGGTRVLGVRLEVIGQPVDARREQGDLDFRRTRVTRGALVLLDDLRLLRNAYRHALL